MLSHTLQFKKRSVCVYQSYRLSKLEKLVLRQLSDVWKFQHSVVDTLDKLAKEIEVKRFARLSN